MSKIPVGQTIRFAYAFTFGEIGSVIGLVWVPTLLATILNFFALRTYLPALNDSLQSGVPLAGATAFLPLVIILTVVLVLSMVGVAITRYVLGEIEGHVFAHVALGVAELRVFVGLVGLFLVINLFFIATLLATGLAGSIGAVILKSTGVAAPIDAIIGLVALIGVSFLVYSAVRLSFLLVPGALEDGAFGLTNSWELTRGNFWRIVIVGLSVLLPLEIVREIAVSAIIAPSVVPELMETAKHAASLPQLVGLQLRAIEPQLPLLMGISLVISPLQYGLLFSAGAYAFRALAGGAQVKSKS